MIWLIIALSVCYLLSGMHAAIRVYDEEPCTDMFDWLGVITVAVIHPLLYAISVIEVLRTIHSERKMNKYRKNHLAGTHNRINEILNKHKNKLENGNN